MSVTASFSERYATKPFQTGMTSFVMQIAFRKINVRIVVCGIR
ncbi:hypothetical protein [Wolbachia endosymbiont (group A) of Bibio marci]|nr:hypothetical protein [Wolbachia endosymbiont (group A) of Bibio marci]